MIFLGTAAADGFPNPFCNCPLCVEARRRPELSRLRSSFLLDARNLIDCGPDFNAAVIRNHLDVSDLRNIYLTHTHEDHFCPSNAGLLSMSRTRTDLPINLYLSEQAYAVVTRQLDLLRDAFGQNDAVKAVTKGRVLLHPVRPGEAFESDGYEVLPVHSTHTASSVENAINFRFTKDGKSLLYACDTGYYIQESLDVLKGSRLDYLVMEGTWGNTTTKPEDSHLHAYAFLKQLDTFKKYDIIREDTKIYCTHINHKHEWNHETYQAFFDSNPDYKVTVAYDGLEI